MYVRILAALALAALPAAPALADWTHPLSGVSIPDVVGDMRVGAERKVLEDGTDTYVQYGTDTEPATIYVYRSSHPNPALWFERTRVAMVGNVGGFDQSVAPRPFTLGPGPTANGVRGQFALPGRPWKATAVAIAQHGEWIVKARATSQTLDPAGVSARLDALLGAVRFANTPKDAPLPLTSPGRCVAGADFKGKPKSGDKHRAMGSVLGLVAFADAHVVAGASGLAGKPTEWCRENVGEMAKALSFYRRIDGTAWTALLGDAGMSASAYAFPESGKPKGAALYLNRTGPALLVETFDALPDLQTGTAAALVTLAGRRRPIATIGVEAK